MKFLGGSFYDIIYYPEIRIGFGFEVNPFSGLTTLKKIMNHEWVSKIHIVDAYYNEKPGKQLRKDRYEQLLGVMTGKMQITILGDLSKTETPKKMAVIDVDQGNYIIDFKFLGEDTLMLITENGLLSVYKFLPKISTFKEWMLENNGDIIGEEEFEKRNYFKIQTVKLPVEENELVTALEISPSENFVVVSCTDMVAQGYFHLISVMNKKSNIAHFTLVPYLEHLEKRPMIGTHDISLGLSSTERPDEVLVNSYNMLLSTTEPGYNIFYLKEDLFNQKNITALNHVEPPYSFRTVGKKVMSIDSNGVINILDADYD